MELTIVVGMKLKVILILLSTVLSANARSVRLPRKMDRSCFNEATGEWSRTGGMCLNRANKIHENMNSQTVLDSKSRAPCFNEHSWTRCLTADMGADRTNFWVKI